MLLTSRVEIVAVSTSRVETLRESTDRFCVKIFVEEIVVAFRLETLIELTFKSEIVKEISMPLTSPVKTTSGASIVRVWPLLLIVLSV